MPGAPGARTFNSYNQPSVNLDGLVVFRARSKGGDKLGQPTHGIYTRDMLTGGEIVRVLDRTTEVPEPNNLGTTFVETPSFPRIDMESDTIATRGNHQPVWTYTPLDSDETRAGTTGIYTNPFRELITGASKLGNVSELSFFEVPEPEFPGTPFEVFPGSPSVTGGNTIVFKGNYTGDRRAARKTGVYYRQLDDQAAGGTSPVVLIANNTDTLIPGTDTVFRLHRSTQRCEREGRVRRLRQRGRPDPGRYLPGAAAIRAATHHAGEHRRTGSRRTCK